MGSSFGDFFSAGLDIVTGGSKSSTGGSQVIDIAAAGFKISAGVQAERTARRARRNERNQRILELKFELAQRAKQVRRLLGSQRAGFGAAGVTLLGTPGVVEEQVLFEQDVLDQFALQAASFDVTSSQAVGKSFEDRGRNQALAGGIDLLDAFF